MSTSPFPAWSSPRFLLLSQGILAYHLLLYFCGVLDVQRFGHVYFLAALAAALLVTATQPGFAVRAAQPPMPSAGSPVVPPARGVTCCWRSPGSVFYGCCCGPWNGSVPRSPGKAAGPPAASR